MSSPSVEELTQINSADLDPSLPPASSEFPPIDFGEATPPTSCSYNICANGHKWPPVLRVAQCPGCGGPILAAKMTQCPVCNEPVARRFIRVDHLPHGGQITPMCRGAGSLAEVMQVEMVCNHASDEEGKYIERQMPGKL